MLLLFFKVALYDVGMLCALDVIRWNLFDPELEKYNVAALKKHK